ncbi:hypothetical protein [Thiomicrorhabdus heinhorstiae]|uniref:hypothetical protein n=1 Tax=Thiomicrorhabdus heinhorstiae TaxID=2748010 RepID=UPI00389A794D
MFLMKCLERFGKMNAGITIKEIVTAIQSTLREHPNLHGVYGFGSFFRCSEFNDIDLLFVSSRSSLNPLDDYYSVKSLMSSLSIEFDIPIDITFLTHAEFEKKPLLESDILVPIIEYKT